MTFPLTPASPFVAFTTRILSATLNAWRVAIAESLDGTAGGEYTPSAPIDIEGAGLIANPFVSANATIASGGTGLSIAAGATETVDGTLTVASDGTLGVAGTWEFTSAGDFAGGVTFNGTTQTVFNTSVVFEGASVAIAGGTTLEVVNTGILEVDVGGNLKVFGTETIETGGTLSALGASFVTLAGVNTFSGVNALSGLNTISGATTQTSACTYLQQGVRTKSGASGYDVRRQTTFTTTQTINGASWDDIFFTSVTNTTITLTLSAPPASGIRTRVIASSVSGIQASGTLIIVDAVTSDTLATLGPGTGGSGAFTGTKYIDCVSIGGMWIGVSTLGGAS